MSLERGARVAIGCRVQMRRFGEFDLLVKIVGDGAFDVGGNDRTMETSKASSACIMPRIE